MSNRARVFLFSVIVMFVVLSLASAANAKSILQLTATPDPSLTPQATPTTSPQSQRLSDLELRELDQRLDEVETELQDLNNPLSGIWLTVSNLLEAALSSGWLIFAIIFLFLFQPQIRGVLDVLPSRMSNAKFKFGDTEITLTDVDNVVLDREILKTMLFVATIDKDPSASELELISEKAFHMNSKFDVLKGEDKREIIQAAIDLAVIDKDFRNEEYGAIKAKAAQYNIPEPEMVRMIEDTCQRTGVAIPSVLDPKAKKT